MPPQRNRLRALFLRAGLAVAASLAPALQAADYFILPAAAGTGDGSSWVNAAAPSDWPASVAKLSAGDTLRIGSGTYDKVQLALTASGRKGAPITLLGED
ncbi:MAG TPA: hypothetical protein VIO38_07620, partial [Rariglobus sp.]